MPSRILRDWTDSEPINVMSLQAECFFVRLIMKADDFGRFSASPKLLRSLLFPIKDGVRDADITRWLAECEKSGQLRVYTSSDAKPLLEIVKFGQRTRAEKSKFEAPPTNVSEPPATAGTPPPYSESNVGVVIRSSETVDAAPPELVFPFVSKDFHEAWADFVAMRSEIKKPLKPTAIKLSFAKLAAMGEATAIQSLKESTANQWQGLFEPKEDRNAGGTGISRQSAGGTNLLTREQQREQQQLGVIASWAKKRSMPTNGVRQGDGSLVGDEANSAAHRP